MDTVADSPNWLAVFGLLTAGGLAVIISFIVLVVQGFRAGVWWGVLVFFVPLLGLIIFACARWNMAKGAFLMHVIGGIVCAIGSYGFYQKGATLFERDESPQTAPETTTVFPAPQPSVVRV